MTWELWAATVAALILMGGIGAFVAAVAWALVRRRASATTTASTSSRSAPATTATAQLAAALRAVQAEGVEAGVERFAGRIRSTAADDAEAKLAGAAGPKSQPP